MVSKTVKRSANVAASKADKALVDAQMKKLLKTVSEPKVKKDSEVLCRRAPHLIVSAFAGCGKTTTIIGALDILYGKKPKITPSVQQKAVWDVISQEKPKTVLFAAFNKSIATELASRVPDGVEARTLHAFGCKILRTDPRTKWLGKPNEYKTINSLERLTGSKLSDMRRNGIPVSEVETLVRLAKMSLIDVDSETIVDDIERLVIEHAMELTVSFETVAGYVIDCLKDALRANDKGRIAEYDFSDMIWLPIVLDIAIDKADLIMVDEGQDLNKCQQELACRMADRVVLVADRKQAIYAFAGADCQSVDNMKKRLEATPRGVVELPLSVTRRCGKAIVDAAKTFVPTFEAHETNCDGEVTSIDDQDFLSVVNDADMVLCRVNAPLVSYCFRLLKQERKARIQGRDIGKGLVDQINKFKAKDLDELVDKLEAWKEKEEAKLLKKKFVSEAALIALNDKFDCIMTFIDNSESVQGLTNKIQTVFSDSGEGVLFSSVHKAKGLEANTVYLLHPELMPHKMAKTEWQMEQEMNIKYIAITRAIRKLVYIKTPSK